MVSNVTSITLSVAVAGSILLARSRNYLHLRDRTARGVPTLALIAGAIVAAIIAELVGAAFWAVLVSTGIVVSVLIVVSVITLVSLNRTLRSPPGVDE